MAEPIAYLNGRFLPYSQATLPLHDAGFVTGATVTDFCRTFRRQPYRWPDHLARFRRDCADCHIPLPHDDRELTVVAGELVARNATLLPPDAELALITFATPGPIPYFVGEPGGAGDGPPTLGMHTLPLQLARYRRFFSEGVILAVHGSQPAGSNALPSPRIKHRSRMHWWLADRAVRRAGAIALLRAAATGGYTETAIGNLLVVRDGVVTSPPRAQILDGISLRVTEGLCRKLGIPFAEKEIGPNDGPFDEAMLTGTAFCLAGVRELDGRPLRWPGPVYQRLLAEWSEEVSVDIAGQILG